MLFGDTAGKRYLCSRLTPHLVWEVLRGDVMPVVISPHSFCTLFQRQAVSWQQTSVSLLAKDGVLWDPLCLMASWVTGILYLQYLLAQ